MIEDPTVTHKSSGWSEITKIAEHIISGFLSNLKGLDLIKSTGDDSMLTDEELRVAEEAGTYEYWVGGEGQPLYRRAEHVIEERGNLAQIIQGYYRFDLPLWPARPERIITMKALIVQQDQHRICLEYNIPDAKLIKLAELTDQREVLVSIESM